MVNRLLHPLSYFLLCIFYSSLAIAIDNPRILVIIMLLAWMVDFRQGFNAAKAKLAKLERLYWLIFSLIVIQLIFRRGGGVALNLGAISIYREALESSAFLSLRIIIVYMCAISLSMLDFSSYRSAFAAIRLPEEISFMVSYMAHLIPAFSARFKDQMQELRDRGISIRKLPLKEKIRLYRILALSAIADIIGQSGRQAIALELRGFRSSGRPSSLYRHRFGFWDLGILLWIIGVSIMVLYLRNSWHGNCTVSVVI